MKNLHKMRIRKPNGKTEIVKLPYANEKQEVLDFIKQQNESKWAVENGYTYEYAGIAK